MADNNLHFEGDPQTDSARRHLERVLKTQDAPPRRWPWILGLVAGGSTWTLWRTLRKKYAQRQRTPG